MKVVLGLVLLILTVNTLKTTLHTATTATTTTTTTNTTKTNSTTNTTANTNTTTPNTTAQTNKTVVEAPKPCGFNDLGAVSGDKNYTFEVKTVKTGGYAQGDFDIKGWKKTSPSSFFKSLGKTANFHDSFVKMGCQLAKKEDLETICGQTKANVDKIYKQHFGPDIIFKCKVPKDSLVLGVEYNIKAGDVKYNSSNWAYFSGLHQYKDLNDAKKVIQTEGKKINKQAKDDKLNCLSLDNSLAFTPAATKKLLASGFNSNSGSSFVKGLKANTAYPLEGEGTLHVVPTGTHFIIGSIFKGTTAVKSICHNLKYKETDNCKLNLA